METITSFLTTTPMFIFLVPVILILVVLLVVINKHNKVEVVAPISVPPVTTTPAPAQATEVVTQAIPSIVQPTPPSMPVQSAEVVIEHNVVTTPTVEPVVVEEIIPEVVAEVVPAPTTETPTPVIAWRPTEPVAVTEEEVPFVASVSTEVVTPVDVVTQTEVITTPTEQVVVDMVEPMPIVTESIPQQTVATEVLDYVPETLSGSEITISELASSPVVEEQVSAITEEILPPPITHSLQSTV